MAGSLVDSGFGHMVMDLRASEALAFQQTNMLFTDSFYPNVKIDSMHIILTIVNPIWLGVCSMQRPTTANSQYIEEIQTWV